MVFFHHQRIWCKKPAFLTMSYKRCKKCQKESESTKPLILQGKSMRLETTFYCCLFTICWLYVLLLHDWQLESADFVPNSARWAQTLCNWPVLSTSQVKIWCFLHVTGNSVLLWISWNVSLEYPYPSSRCLVASDSCKNNYSESPKLFAAATVHVGGESWY